MTYALLIVAPLLLAIPASPQFPGGGIPIPRRGKQPPPAKTAATKTLTGVVLRISDKTIDIETEDARTLSVKRTSQTVMPEPPLQPGDRIGIEATQGEDGWYTAVTIKLEKAAPPVPTAPSVPPDEPSAEKKPASEIPPLDGDDGPPRVKRGKPAPRKPASLPEVAETKPGEWRDSVEPATPRPQQAEDKTIARARANVASYLQSLPNYFCQQQTARFVSTVRPPDWRAVDIVSASLVYEDGKERYTDLKVNGKPVKQKMDELSGSWSTGEFGTVLLDLFHPSTAADFWPLRTSTTGGRAADVYGFEVDQPHSHWTVNVAGQVYRPAYKGSVWLDRDTGHVLRVEMQARQLPQDFPLNAVESAVDLAFVRLADREFLLPIHAETLSCTRGSSACSRNVIDFRNYRRFSGESKITY